MGRVRRYKKFKAVDPCAKGKTKKDSDRDRNLPPDVKNHQAQRVNASQAREGISGESNRVLPISWLGIISGRDWVEIFRGVKTIPQDPKRGVRCGD